MFFIILGTYTRWTFIIFSLVERILLLIFQCHTVTHGTDLRRSPLEYSLPIYGHLSLEKVWDGAILEILSVCEPQKV